MKDWDGERKGFGDERLGGEARDRVVGRRDWKGEMKDWVGEMRGWSRKLKEG